MKNKLILKETTFLTEIVWMKLDLTTWKPAIKTKSMWTNGKFDICRGRLVTSCVSWEKFVSPGIQLYFRFIGIFFFFSICLPVKIMSSLMASERRKASNKGAVRMKNVLFAYWRTNVAVIERGLGFLFWFTSVAK